MRVFYAIVPPPEIKHQIYSTVNRLLNNNSSIIKDISIVPEENLHITLKFIGNFSSEKPIETLYTIASKSASSSFVKNEIPSISLTNFGCFPSEQNNPRVLWAGISLSNNVSFLTDVSSQISKYLKEYSIPFKEDLHNKKEGKQDFTPHITVARIKRLSSGVRDFIRQLLIMNQLTNSFCPDGIHLMESFLEPSGARYKSIFFAPFKIERDN